MAYTPFAILAATLVVGMAANSGVEYTKDSIPTQRVGSIQENWATSQANYALEAVQNAANISTSQNIQNFQTAVKNLTVNGSYQGWNIQKSSYSSWNQVITSRDAEITSTGLEKLDIEIDGLQLETESILTLETDSIRKRTKTQSSIQIRNVKDPLLEAESITKTVDSCDFQQLAIRAEGGDFRNGTSRGRPLVEPQDLGRILEPENTIIITSDISSYDNETVSNFAGYYSMVSPQQPDRYNENYVIGGASVPEFTQGQNAVIHDGLWKTNLMKMIENDCYLESELVRTPSIPERIEKDATGEKPGGVFTLVNRTEANSNIGYETINSSGMELVEIEGVSNGEGIINSEFRMSRQIAEESGLTGLIE